MGHPRVREREDGVDGVAVPSATAATSAERVEPPALGFGRCAPATAPAQRRNARAAVRSVAVHGAMTAIMVTTMVGAHSVPATLAGAATLVAAAMLLAPVARDDAAARAHVLDSFAMALALIAVMQTGIVDAAGSVHGHADGIHVPSSDAALALVAVGWAAARVALLIVARTGRRASVVGAAVMAAGFALMAGMS